MNKLQITSSISILIGAFFILLISLSVSNPVLSTGSDLNHSDRRFYMNSRILPDHVAYPILMLIDKAALEITPAAQKTQLRLEYGWRRLEYTRLLLEKNELDLALTTLTKSQKYMLHGAQEVLDASFDEQRSQEMLKHLMAYSREVMVLQSSFGDADKAVIDHLLTECEALKLRLSQSLSL